MSYYSSYTGPSGRRFYDRQDYEDSLAPPAYGPRWLANIYGPVSRFCLQGAAEKVDGLLRRLDERGEAWQQPSATTHKTMPAGIFVSGTARGLRHIQRRIAKPWLAMVTAAALVMGASSLLGAGLVVGAVAAIVALPVSTGVAALGLMGAFGALRTVGEAGRALCNIPAGFARRQDFSDAQKDKQDEADAEEKRHLSPLCQAVFDDEQQAAKASPADRANWIYGLARHFPDEFLAAAKKAETREAVPARVMPKKAKVTLNV